jgi:hypothetical protein
VFYLIYFLLFGPVTYVSLFICSLRAKLRFTRSLLTKKEKTVFFLLCGKQAKIDALIFLIFYCVSSILSATGWGLSAVSGQNYVLPSLCLPT